MRRIADQIATQRTRAAFHEAGHFVVGAYYYQDNIHYPMWIKPDGNGCAPLQRNWRTWQDVVGLVSSVRIGDDRLRHIMFRGVVWQIQGILAGPVAEDLACDSGVLDHSDSLYHLLRWMEPEFPFDDGEMYTLHPENRQPPTTDVDQEIHLLEALWKVAGERREGEDGRDRLSWMVAAHERALARTYSLLRKPEVWRHARYLARQLEKTGSISEDQLCRFVYRREIPRWHRRGPTPTPPSSEPAARSNTSRRPGRKFSGRKDRQLST